MTDELTSFMLTSITGIAKEKRKGGTDSETITERTKCLLNTTGIEPLCGELSEIQSRSFVIDFERKYQTNACFIESDVIAAVQKNRNLILSALMKRTCEVLAMIKDGARTQAMNLLFQTLGDHDKRRCNEYLSLMYLMLLSSLSPDERVPRLEKLNPEFMEQIQNLNQSTQTTARESNHTATALMTLFRAWDQANEASQQAIFSQGGGKDYVQEFVARYQVRPDRSGTLKHLLSKELFVALKRVARDFGLVFEMNSPRQFAQRFSNDLETIRSSGFEVEIIKKSCGTKLFTIGMTDLDTLRQPDKLKR